MGCSRLAWAWLTSMYSACVQAFGSLHWRTRKAQTGKVGNERVRRQGVDRLGVSRSWLANQHVGPQPLKIGRDASILKLGQNGVTETIQNIE